MADTVTEKLLPCPFCGTALEADTDLHGNRVWAHEGDEKDGADRCVLTNYLVFDRPTSLAKWNRRTAPAEPVALEAAEALASMADYYDAKSAETMKVALKLRFDSSARRLRELAKALADGSALASPTITDEMVERLERELHAARAVIDVQRTRLVELQEWANARGGKHD